MEVQRNDEYSQIHNKLSTQEISYRNNIELFRNQFICGQISKEEVLNQVENELKRLEIILEKLRNLFDETSLEDYEFDVRAQIMEIHEQNYEDLLSESDKMIKIVAK